MSWYQTIGQVSHLVRRNVIGGRRLISHLIFFKQIMISPTQRKHVWEWMKSYKKNYLLIKTIPWLPFDAIAYLSKLNLEGKMIFEYGSGGSTLFWLKKGASCVSIEYDPLWYSKIKASLRPGDKLDFRLVKPEENKQSGDPADPEDYLSNSPGFKDYSFKYYVEQIDEFPKEYFDLVMIDGRSRPACIKHSVSKIKLGGVLILDDADRDYYFKFTKGFFTNFTLRKFIGVGPCLDFQISTDIYIRDR
jgi:hypothetical protein